MERFPRPMVRRPRFSPVWRAGLAIAVVLAGALGTAPAEAGLVPPSAPSAAAATPRPDDPVAHDPTMVKEGDWYYLVIPATLAGPAPSCRSSGRRTSCTGPS
jgi:hypothetical protein